MSVIEWQRRIDRAHELAARYAFAAEILRFYEAIARFQAKLYREIESLGWVRDLAADPDPFRLRLNRNVAGSFPAFLAVVEQSAPDRLREAAREFGTHAEDSYFELLTALWEVDGPALAATTDAFLARAFLQPYAVGIRERANLRWTGPTAYVCPFCKRKPGAGVLRPLGEGGQRSLVCSFCLGEWEFRRILCPGCGETDPAKLPVYTAEELQHVRVEACDSCKSYIKTVDFTKSGLGDPVVDEMAAVPLDLWAQQRGYTKLQVNLLQL
jgi:formate dehydrogenase accessory protein FdhE